MAFEAPPSEGPVARLVRWGFGLVLLAGGVAGALYGGGHAAHSLAVWSWGPSRCEVVDVWVEELRPWRGRIWFTGRYEVHWELHDLDRGHIFDDVSATQVAASTTNPPTTTWRSGPRARERSSSAALHPMAAPHTYALSPRSCWCSAPSACSSRGSLRSAVSSPCGHGSSMMCSAASIDRVRGECGYPD